MRVEPPTMTISSIFETSSFASASALERRDHAIGEIARHPLEVGARERDVEVLGRAFGIP
jgi:hypothetical protein